MLAPQRGLIAIAKSKPKTEKTVHCRLPELSNFGSPPAEPVGAFGEVGRHRVPQPRAHLVRYGGCLAPHSKVRAAIIPTPRQQGMDEDETKTGIPYWNWARLLGRVFDPDMATCPFCRRGSLRLIAAITRESVITRILRHLKLASVPPPIAPARCRQELFAFN